MRAFVIVWSMAMGASLLAASDTRTIVPPGATREDVINAYGWPNGQSQAGTKEILSYAQGDVILDHGRVERVNFSRDVPWQAPRPRPAASSSSTRKEHALPVDVWRTSFSDALREAQDRRVRILALFTSSDGSPLGRRFHDEVEDSPEFVDAFAGDFVFLKLDFSQGISVPPGLTAENARLRQHYGVTTYPSLLVLSPQGDLLRRVDLGVGLAAESLCSHAIAAVREARDSKAPPDAVAMKPTVDPLKRELDSVTVSPAAPAMWTAGRLIVWALLLGAVLALLMFIRLSRQLKVKSPKLAAGMAERIANAAAGVPSADEMTGWSKEQLRITAAALAELDGYSVVFRPPTGDVDLELRRSGDLNPRVLVVCWPAADHVPTKRLRELFANFTAEGAETGWLVSPSPFTGEARSYAASHAIRLMDGDRLHEMLRDLPPVVLTSILPKQGRDGGA